MAVQSRLPRILGLWIFLLLVVVWALSIGSTATPDWSNWVGGKTGIWKSCVSGGGCSNIRSSDLDALSSKCRTGFNSVRAFSLMTIIFGFISSLLVCVHDNKGWSSMMRTCMILTTFFFITCTMIWSICAFAIWLNVADKNNCLGPNVRGPAWSLAVAASAIAMFVWLLSIPWALLHFMAARPPAKSAAPVPVPPPVVVRQEPYLAYPQATITQEVVYPPPQYTPNTPVTLQA